MHETFLQKVERLFGLFWHPIRIWFTNQFHRHDRIKLNIHNSWHDKDYKLEQAAVVLLIDFIEKEHDGIAEYIDNAKYQDEHRYQVMMNLVDAYDFFKHELPTMQAEIDSLYLDEELTKDAEECEKSAPPGVYFFNYITHSKRFKIYKQLSDTLDKERNYYLEIVWKNRGFLWT